MFKLIQRITKPLMAMAIIFATGSSVAMSQTNVSLPTVKGQPGDTLMMDINVDDITGDDVFTFDFKFSYNQDVIQIIGTETSGTITDGLDGFQDYNDTDNSIYNLSGFRLTSFTGEGSFITVKAVVIENGRSDLTWTKAELNKQDDTALATQTVDGEVFVPNVQIVADDLIVPLGQPFSFPFLTNYLTERDEVVAVDYTITYDESVLEDVTIDIEESILSGLDYSVNSEVPGTITFAVGSGTSIIGTGVLFTMTGNPINTGDASVSVESATFKKNDDSVVLKDEDYGMLVVSESIITVSSIEAIKGSTIAWPILIEGSEKPISGYSIDFSYDDTQIDVVGVDIEGTLSEGSTVETNKTAGQFVVGVANSTGITGEDVLLNLNVKMLEVGEASLSVDALQFTTFDLADEILVMGSVDGKVIITQNTAPVFTATVSDTVVTRGDTFVFSYAATDADGDVLTYSTDGSVLGVEINSETGLLEWTPSPTQIGENTLAIRVSDGETTVSTTTAVTVNPLTVRAQIIHNAADPILESVDVYANGSILIPSLGFREATSFFDVPAEVEIDIDLYLEGTTPEMDSPAYTAEGVVFVPGKTYTIIANGLATDGFAENPNGIPTSFDLFVYDDAKESHENAEESSIYVWHGVTDAPAVDIYVREVGKVVEAAMYEDRTEYLNVPATEYILDITAAGSTDVLLSYTADLSSAGGQVVGVLASGFLDPSMNKDGAAFGLLAVFADGSTALLPTAEGPTVDVTFTVYLDLASNFNPANDDLYLSGSFVGGGGWDQPGSNATAKLEPVDGNQQLYSITYAIMKGDHAYKYFSVPKGTTSWDNGEWPGDPNRTISVMDDMEVSDLYGVKPGETVTIKTARGLQSGAPVLVAGVSTTPDFGFNSAQFYMQDAEAGVKVFHRGTGGGNTDTPYEEGQSLIMEGSMGDFNDEVQLAATGFTVVSEGNGLPDPVILPSYDEWVVDSKYQGMRITLTNMVLPEASGWPVDKITSGSGVTTQIEGTLEQLLGTYDVRIDRDESFFDESARPTGNFNMTGVMGRFRSNVQLFPFFEEELGEATSNEIENGLPTVIELTQNYPNPFNPSTQITFALPEASDVRLDVYNVMGQRVASLVNGKLNAGYHTVQFDATSLSSGTYFYRIMAGSFIQTRSMMLIK